MQAQAQAIIIGGGAAGFFAAIRLAEAAPQLGVTILEASAQTLSKVRISGGGRCNVTHDCLQPKDLVRHYPRGERELRGPFHHFGAAETISWFAQRGVELKTEADGRMFPTTDNSETIVQALSQAAQTAGVTVHTKTAVTAIERSATGFSCHTAKHRFAADACLVATGGSPKGQALLASLGVPLVPGIPSLFTAHCPVPWLHALAGISVPDASITLRVQDETITARGPLLCTHRGLSGPAMLRASAWGARLLHGVHYRCDLTVNWLASENAQQLLIQYQSENGQN